MIINQGGIRMRFACLIADGFEDIEAIGTVALLRRADIQVDLVSVTNQPTVTGYYQSVVKADLPMAKCRVANYDGLLIPGGKHARTLCESPDVLAMVREFYRKDKWMAAICAAPSVFGAAGIMKGKRFTAFPSIERLVPDGLYEKKLAVTDGKIITGLAAGAVYEFAFEIIRQVLGSDKRDDMVKKILYHADETEK
jgi:DJ-1 family protein